jgi:hypothetical protein
MGTFNISIITKLIGHCFLPEVRNQQFVPKCEGFKWYSLVVYCIISVLKHPNALVVRHCGWLFGSMIGILMVEPVKGAHSASGGPMKKTIQGM